MQDMKTDALILTGGKSSRMGGRHKGSLLYEHRTLTARMVEELQKRADTVYISYGRHPREDTSLGVPVQDIYPDCGPMSGLHAGLLASLQAGRADYVLTAPCDMPLLKAEFYDYLLQASAESSADPETEDGLPDAVVPCRGDFPEPLAALYRPSASAFFARQLLTGQYRLRLALARMNVLYVDLTGQPALTDMLLNVNTPADYESLIHPTRT